MERLTERLENGVINVKYASQHETAIHRLAAIEDIQVAAMCKKFLEMEGKK